MRFVAGIGLDFDRLIWNVCVCLVGLGSLKH